MFDSFFNFDEELQNPDFSGCFLESSCLDIVILWDPARAGPFSQTTARGAAAARRF